MTIKRLTLHTFLTLDGVMQGPGGRDEDTTGGFTAGGWQVPYNDDYNDDVFGEIVTTWFEQTTALLLGRITFEMFRSYWPEVSDDDPVAREINHGPKYVVAHAGYEPDWENTNLIPGPDALDAISDLRQHGEGELQVHGSWQLAKALHQAGMVDEYRLFVFPVTVGAGKRLFDDNGPPRGFTVHETRTTSTGATYLVVTATPFQHGTYVVEDGREVPVLE